MTVLDVTIPTYFLSLLPPCRSSISRWRRGKLVALTSCVMEGGNLASIETQEEQDTVLIWQRSTVLGVDSQTS